MYDITPDDAEANMEFINSRADLLAALELIAIDSHSIWCRCRYWFLTFVVNRWCKSQ